MRGVVCLAVVAAAAGCHLGPLNRDEADERPWSPLPPQRRPSAAPGAPAVLPAAATVTRPDGRPAGAQAPASPAPGGGGEPAAPVLPPPGRPLTLADIEGVALANNPTIAAAEALVRQQEGVLRQDTLYPNPTAGYLRSDPDRPDQSATQGVFLSQDVVTAGKLRLAGEAGREEVEWRRWQLAAQRGRVVNDVRIRYYEVLGAQQTIRAAEELERLAEDGVRAAEAMVKAKQAARPDVLQAEVQLAAARTAAQDARFRHQAGWTQLANVAGVPGLPSAPLAADLEANLPRLDWDESVRRLLAESPVLKAQEAQVRAAGWDLDLARAGAVPNVNVQVVVQRDRVQKYTSVSPLVSMPLPVFNRNQGNVRSAAGQLDAQRKELERTALALRDQLAAAYQQYQSAVHQAERLRADILPRVRENLELVTRGYAAGQFDVTRVLAARQAYFETTTAYIDTLTAAHKVAVEIDGLGLTGGLNPTEIGAALQTPLGPAGGTGPRSVLLQQLQQQQGGGSRLLPGAVQGGAR